ncbi:MAG: sensor histidine kinase [Candidatus Marinarcus sp.]|uniref:sensor histidine kinase n=1 Tax=Candidatus Marinarcus sp. TaxID=3100987 RepID=UPI003AFF6FE9
MNNRSIKGKLLFYYLVVQTIILLIFSYALYSTLKKSAQDKVESNLKVILLDVVDDIEKYSLANAPLDEEHEFEIKPLYLTIYKIDTQKQKIEIIREDKRPYLIESDYKKVSSYKMNKMYFESSDNFVMGEIKIKENKNILIIQALSTHETLNKTLENLTLIILFLLPIVIILSIVGGNFIVYKSFLPIENLLKDIKRIKAKDLSQRIKTQDNKDEISELSKEINNLLERLEHSFEKVSQFSSDASHELKTPLTIIRGELEVALRRQRTTNEYEQTIQSCLDEILIIQKTIENLFFLAKPDTDIKKLPKDTINTKTLCESVVLEMGKLAKSKEVNLLLHSKDETTIQGYESLLKIALKNLLENAIYYSPSHSSVHINIEKQASHTLIKIQDFGVGIEKNQQEKIFEKFYRIDQSRNKNSGGTGLGMAIVKRIIDLHQAQIVLHSKKNVGTTFELFFP